MAGNCKKKALRSAKNKKLNLRTKKVAATRRNKIRVLKRHIQAHPKDAGATKALDKWEKV